MNMFMCGMCYLLTLAGRIWQGMEGLRAHIRDSLSDFQFYPKWVSGGHLATMLEALVHAANNNMMESVPSVWSLFVQKQVGKIAHKTPSVNKSPHVLAPVNQRRGSSASLFHSEL